MKHLKSPVKTSTIGMAIIGIAAIALCGVTIQAHAQVYSPLYYFSGGSEPSHPAAILTQGRDGNLYGVSHSGGSSPNCANGCGTIYQMTPSGSPDVIYSFNTSDGCSGLSLGSDGNFYGACSNGGAYGMGYVFQATPPPTQVNSLYSFCQQPSCPDGANPSDRPTQGADGNYYGTTIIGGANNTGTVYRITPSGTLNTIWSFSTDPDISYPSGPLFLGSNGNLYGATKGGNTAQPACPPSCGAVYEINNTGTSFKLLHRFVNSLSDGATPNALIQDSNGNFYGTTLQGGTNGLGTLFRILPQGEDSRDPSTFSPYSILYNFQSQTDGLPRGLTQASNGVLYGDAYGSNQNGSLYGITPVAGSLVYSLAFTDTQTMGSHPDSALSHTSGILYGVTDVGGTSNDGVFYSLSLSDGAAYCRPQVVVGQVGATIGILGQGFSSSSKVYFGNIQATSITLIGSNYISAQIPSGAQTGTLTVMTGSEKLNSLGPFYVLP